MIEELNNFNVSTGYLCPNERPRIFLRKMASLKLRPKKVLSICSGGEMPLMMLPFAEEVLAIDHSRKSLDTALTKIKLLRQHGPDGWMSLLRMPQTTFFSRWQALTQDQTGYYAGGDNVSEMLRVWADIPARIRHLIPARLDRLKLLHGDFLDASDRGPFDVMYLSNALEHSGRTHTHRLVERKDLILSLLAPGGVIFYTRSIYNTPSTATFEGAQVIVTGPIASPWGGQWHYEMVRKP